MQYIWKNDGYNSFDDFLLALRQSKRNAIRKERRKVERAGITCVSPDPLLFSTLGLFVYGCIHVLHVYMKICVIYISMYFYLYNISVGALSL